MPWKKAARAWISSVQNTRIIQRNWWCALFVFGCTLISLLFTVVDYIFGTKFNSVNTHSPDAKWKHQPRHKTDVQNTGWKKVRAARWPKLMFAHAKSVCLHAQWLQPFFFGRRAVLLFQCRSWVSVWMNMFFNCLLIFCVTHTKKNGPRILISLCHLQGGSNLHTLFFSRNVNTI